jgi:hypothetical protein
MGPRMRIWATQMVFSNPSILHIDYEKGGLTMAVQHVSTNWVERYRIGPSFRRVDKPG